MKKISDTIKIKRYRPLWGVLDSDWDEAWDEDKKLEAILTGGDLPAHINSCVDSDLLNTDLVLNRIQKFVDQKTAPEDEVFPDKFKFDLESVCSKLGATVKAITGLNRNIDLQDKTNQKLLLLMFELGTQVGAVNLQDMYAHGITSIRGKHIANIGSQEERTKRANARKDAYLNIFAEMSVKEVPKITYEGLISYLSTLPDKTYLSGIAGCERIWLMKINNEGWVLFDSESKDKGAGKRQIGKFLKDYKSQN